MAVTTNKLSKKEAEKAERAAAFRAMAAELDGELKTGKAAPRVAKARKEHKGLERYSELNLLLIVTQCPHVTEVHGYVEWRDLGYQVRKGEKGIAICAPHTKPAKEGEEAGKIGFHRTYVFDRSQVDPIEPGQDAAQAPEATGGNQEPEAGPAAETGEAE